MKKQALGPAITGFFALLLLVSFSADALAEIESGPPVDSLHLEDVPFFQYDLKLGDDPGAVYQLNLPVSLELSGIYGPLPEKHPVVDYYWNAFSDAGRNKPLEPKRETGRKYLSPFMRVIGMQAAGNPITIRVRAPKPEEITLPLAGDGGSEGNVSYRVNKRELLFHQVDGFDNASVAADKVAQLINFNNNEESLEISWTPTLNEDGRVVSPEAFELILKYEILRDVLTEGKSTGDTEKIWAKKRIAWFALPTCGQRYGEYAEPIICPEHLSPLLSGKNTPWGQSGCRFRITGPLIPMQAAANLSSGMRLPG